MQTPARSRASRLTARGGRALPSLSPATARRTWNATFAATIRATSRTRRGFWVTTLDVSVGADSADFAIVERLQAGDVVVTQDIGLASMVLGRDAAAIGVRGRVYDKATIDMQLFIRHEEKKVRRAGGRTRGPAAFTSEDRARFKRNLTELLR